MVEMMSEDKVDMVGLVSPSGNRKYEMATIKSQRGLNLDFESLPWHQESIVTSHNHVKYDMYDPLPQ